MKKKIENHASGVGSKVTEIRMFCQLLKEIRPDVN